MHFNRLIQILFLFICLFKLHNVFQFIIAYDENTKPNDHSIKNQVSDSDNNAVQSLDQDETNNLSNEPDDDLRSFRIEFDLSNDENQLSDMLSQQLDSLNDIETKFTENDLKQLSEIGIDKQMLQILQDVIDQVTDTSFKSDNNQLQFNLKTMKNFLLNS